MDKLEKLEKSFRAKLREQLLYEVDYYNFNVTNACKRWIESVINYYADEIFSSYEWSEEIFGSYDDLDYEELFQGLEDMEMDEEEAFDWPSGSEASRIVNDAIRRDSSHFEYITERQGFSMTAEDCFKAEWFWKGSMRPYIFDWMKEFFGV